MGNESLNAKILMIAPETSPGSNKTVNVASSIATATFNDGAGVHLRILKLIEATVGSGAHHYSTDEDSNRLEHARIQTIKGTKDARAARR